MISIQTFFAHLKFSSKIKPEKHSSGFAQANKLLRKANTNSFFSNHIQNHSLRMENQALITPLQIFKIPHVFHPNAPPSSPDAAFQKSQQIASLRHVQLLPELSAGFVNRVDAKAEYIGNIRNVKARTEKTTQTHVLLFQVRISRHKFVLKVVKQDINRIVKAVPIQLPLAVAYQLESFQRRTAVKHRFPDAYQMMHYIQIPGGRTLQFFIGKNKQLPNPPLECVSLPSGEGNGEAHR